MAKYHINSKGNPAPCRAIKGKCPFGGADQHFGSRQEAFAEAERRHEQESGFSADKLEINWGADVVATNRVDTDNGYTETLVQTLPSGKTREFIHNNTVWDDGSICDEVTDTKGKMHCDGSFPAAVVREKQPDGSFTIKSQGWYKHGKLHRSDDLPAFVSAGDNDFAGVQEWWQNGEMHRDGEKPAYIVNHRNGGQEEQWWQHDQMKRDGDKPVKVVKDADGSVTWERFSDSFGRFHRDGDKPASTSYHKNGQVKEETWYQNGLMHREGGPAQVTYAEDGTVVKEFWAKFGSEDLSHRR